MTITVAVVTIDAAGQGPQRRPWSRMIGGPVTDPASHLVRTDRLPAFAVRVPQGT